MRDLFLVQRVQIFISTDNHSFQGELQWQDEVRQRGKVFPFIKATIFQTLCLEFFIPHCHRWMMNIPNSPALKVNDKNFPFFNACHGIFLNYCWKTGGTNEKVTLSFSMCFKLSRQNHNRWEGVNVNISHN